MNQNADRSSGSSPAESSPSSALSFARTGLAGILLALAAFSLVGAVGILLLTTNGWTDTMDSPLRSKLWALLPLAAALLLGRLGLRALREPAFSLGTDDLIWHRRGEEDEVFPFASIETVDLDRGALALKVLEDEDEPLAEFRLGLFGIPQPQRRLLAQAVQGKVKAWEEANS